MKLSVSGSILVGALIISASIFIGGKALHSSSNPSVTGDPTQSPSPTAVQVSTGDMPILGNKDAKVTFVEFGDYQCPFCEQFFTQIEPQLKKDYIDTGKVKLAFRDFAFLGQPQSDPAGDESTNAANAARCANDQGKFWEYHDYLYLHQEQEDQGTFSKDNLKKFASDLGFNTDQFNSCVDSDKYVSEVKADMSTAQKIGVSSTPASFINGQLVSGAQPYSVFKTVIDQQLAQAK